MYVPKDWSDICLLEPKMLKHIFYSMLAISADFERFGMLNNDMGAHNIFITHRGHVMLLSIE